MFKLKINSKIQPGTYFYFLGSEDPNDWYKIISVNKELSHFTFVWIASNNSDNVAYPLKTSLSSYQKEIINGEMIIVDEKDYWRAPKILKDYPNV